MKNLRFDAAGISPIVSYLIVIAVIIFASIIGYAFVVAQHPNPSFTNLDKNGDNAGKVLTNVSLPQNTTIIVTSNAAGWKAVKIDGVAVTAPAISVWNVGSSHTIEAVSAMDNGSTQYVWTGWSDGGTQTHNYIVPNSSETITANYRTQYYLNVTSLYGSPTPKAGWFDSGTSITASILSSAGQVDAAANICSGWTGTGSVPSSGNSTSSTFSISAPSSITWNWIERFQVNFVSSSSDSGLTVPSGADLYPRELLSISAIPKAGFKFSFWNASGLAFISDPSTATTTAFLNGTGTITANFVPASVTITVGSNPVGSGFVKVDGSLKVTPYSASWQVGSVHSLEAVTQVAMNADTRYVWTMWSDGGGQIHNLNVTAADQTITANFKIQYQVTFSVTPAGAGVINPLGANWYDSGSMVSLSATGNSGYSLSSWGATGSISISNQSSTSTTASVSSPGTVTAQFALSNVVITIRSNPVGAGFLKVDGVLQVTPYSVTWVGGSTHTLEAVSPVAGTAGLQYVWQSWSDGGFRNNTFTVPSSSTTIDATYKTQYLLTIKTDGLFSNQSIVANVKIGGVIAGTANDASPFSQWIDANSPIGALSIDGIVFAGADTQRVFYHWADDYSLTNQRSIAAISSPLSLIADYQTLYKVVFSTNLGIGTINPSGSNNWYLPGSLVPINATVNFPNTFSSWNETGSISIADLYASNTSATINGPGTVVANFVRGSTTVLVTILSNVPNVPYIKVDDDVFSPPQAFAWTIGDEHRIEAISNFSTPDTQLVWTGWSDGGAQSHKLIVPNISTTITVNYNLQYFLTVNGGANATTSGQNWYTAGTNASFSISPTTISGSGYSYLFSGWIGTGSGSYNGPLASYSVIMNNSITETGNWTTQYQVTFVSSPSGGGSMSPSGTSLLSPGALSISATANSGYKFSSWTASGSITFGNASSASTTATINGAGTITANFVAQYQVTFVSSPSGGGSMSPSGTSLLSPGALSISATANSGYKFSSWTASGSITFGNASSASTTATINGAGTITANFVAQYQVTFVSSPSGGGSMSPSGTSLLSPGALSISATANSGYKFSSWTASGSITFGNASSASTTATINGAGTITANFVAQYQVTFVSSPSGGGSMSPSGTSLLSPGALSISATANSGYKFSSWTASGSITFGNASSASTTATINGAGTITANFVAQYSVNFVLGAGGSTINPAAGSHTYDSGSTVAISAVADGTHSFSQWTATGSITFDNANSASTNAHVNGAGSITANFVGVQYSVTFVLGAGGSTINPAAGSHTYDSGSTVAISAVADGTHSFSQWTATGSITFDNANSASTNAHVNGAGSITANFVGVQYSVTFVLGAGGSTINPAAGSHTYDSGSTVAISAVADGTHSFSQWTATGSITFDNANSASTNAHVNGAGSITANFVGVQYSVTFVLGAGGSTINPAAGSHTYDSGSTVAISAVADGTHSFSQWTATGSITFDNANSASTNAHVNGAGSITANFVGVQYSVTFVLGAGGSTINPAAGSHTYDSGSTVAISAVADGTHSFSQWTATGSITFDNANSASTNAHVNGAGSITANFVGVQYSVTFVLGAGGSTINPAAGSHTYDSGSTVAISAVADGTHSFSQWTATGSITFDNANSASTNAHVNGAGSITANFVGVQYSVTFVLGAGGSTINPAAGSHTYDSGSTVAISAVADGTHSFSQWTATGSITFDNANSASTNAHVNGAGSITANFNVVSTQQVAFVSAGAGSGSGTGDVTPSYPSGLQGNDLILLQVVAKGDSPSIPTAPAGFTLLFGPDSSGTSGAQHVTQWIYYKFASGGETGSVTVHITQTTIVGRGAMMYAFRNVALSNFVEGGGVGTAHSNVYAAQTVATSGAKRLAVSFEAIGDNPGLGNFAGESGGDWALTPAGSWFNGNQGSSLFDIGLQTATMASQGTISGGTDSHSTCDWIVRSFALIPR